MNKQEILKAFIDHNFDWYEAKYKRQSYNFFSEKEVPNEIIENIGLIKTMETYGGEGEGDQYWVVIYLEKHDLYIRNDGWYTSYDGGNFDDVPYFVKPKEKTVIFYEKE